MRLHKTLLKTQRTLCGVTGPAPIELSTLVFPTKFIFLPLIDSDNGNELGDQEKESCLR